MMRNVQRYFSAVIIAFTTLILSCEPRQAELPPDELKSSINERLSWKTRFPVNTKIEKASEGFMIELPAGFYFEGKLKSGEVVAFSAGSVTCECKSSTGSCSPYRRSAEVGCLMSGGCTLCEATYTKRTGTVEPVDEVVVKIGQASRFREYKESFLVPGVVAALAVKPTERVPLNAIQSFDELQQIKSITEADLAHPDFQRTLKEFGEFVYGTDERPLRNQLTRPTPVSIGGKLLLMHLPIKFFGDQAQFRPLPESYRTLVAGSCSGCNGNCKYHKVWTPITGTIEYCDGCSSGCTLHY